MDIPDRVDRIAQSLSGTSSNSAYLYARGVKAKWEQVLYSLETIKALQAPLLQFDSGSSDDFVSNVSRQDLENLEMRIRYHCDAFWTCLYSTLDIVAQMTNAIMGNPCDEQDASFNWLVGYLRDTELASPLQTQIQTLRDSRAFGNLSAFRRCNIHRRPIYIQRQDISGTPGYVGIHNYRWLICDDPLDINPTVSQQRDLVPFIEGTLASISRCLDLILIPIGRLI